MGGSHNSMVTLENRVRGLERVVEDMARDLSISSGRRGGNFAMGFEGSSNRPLGKYNGFPDYSTAKFGRGSDGRIPFGERIAQSDGIALGMRGRGPPWRSDMSEAWDFPTSGASRNGQIGSRRALGGSSMDGRSPKSDHESDQGGSRRAWDKGAGPVRFGEGPSARSVWQASKDEATLEAIRVAGEDGGTSRTARVAIPEMTAEAMGDDNVGHDRDPVWTSWSNAMDALHVGDMDSAYAEVLSTGDDHLLVKLMDRSGPVVDQLSGEVATEVVNAVGQFLLEQNLFDLCLSWIQQVWLFHNLQIFFKLLSMAYWHVYFSLVFIDLLVYSFLLFLMNHVNNVNTIDYYYFFIYKKLLNLLVLRFKKIKQILESFFLG